MNPENNIGINSNNSEARKPISPVELLATMDKKIQEEFANEFDRQTDFKNMWFNNLPEYIAKEDLPPEALEKIRLMLLGITYAADKDKASIAKESAREIVIFLEEYLK